MTGVTGGGYTTTNGISMPGLGADARHLERFVLGVEGEKWILSKVHIRERCPLVRLGHLDEDVVGEIEVEDWN